ncbi:four-carbon acid sugar kinase family protein [Paenibacillus alkalitolerans]|uniref:four-carbon acid sugar kinase family protein n=1 Tax=Paenibacillus alkalitolerans TaxID=2799335 RepID=UPI002D7F2A2C|nr:four-carbon acid sugar kinase family protein [Paenibacillus alkalitolerans]
MQICYYGDDFTGSTDALEALLNGGLRVILFMDVPDLALWNEKFREYDGFGVAGVSRTMSPREMERTLKPALAALRKFGSRIVHYKICSTFDSSPETGSIGKAIDIGRELFPEQRYIPLLAGAPALKRYTVFGNHFCGAGEHTVRLDRHPNMSRHPVTPMNEADLRLHLTKQTAKSIGLMDILDLELDGPMLEQRHNQRCGSRPDILLFDVLTDEHLLKIGGLLSRESERAPLFAVGSSGIEYALVKHWRRSGKLPPVPPAFQAEPADRLLVISGSCSPVTQDQIEWAQNHGFAGIRIHADSMLEGGADTDALEQAERLLRDGRNVILYTALGPEDVSIVQTQEWLQAHGFGTAESGKLIGSRLGEAAKKLLLSSGLKRVVIAGGDTSGFAVKQLGVYALEMIAPLVPGGPLCRAYSGDDRLDGLEIVLKGGQVGQETFFEQVRMGKA